MTIRSHTLSQCALAALISASTFGLHAQPTQIDSTNWGSVTAPVYGQMEKGVYKDAELFAGPNKFGAYNAGVLPNGRIVKPAGATIQVGMNPLGIALSSDGKYLVTSNDDEREGGLPSLQSPINVGAYSLTVIDTASMAVVSQIATTDKFFVGLQVTGTGPYTVWASGGADHDVKIYAIDANGMISKGNSARIKIAPILPANAGYVSNYVPDAALSTADANGNLPPVPTGFDRKNGAQMTFPAGSALSADGKYLYVACNGDNSVAVIDTNKQQVVQQVPVGYFPYSVSVSPLGGKVVVSNWGITEYKFTNPTYDPASGKLTAVAPTGSNMPAGFFPAAASTAGANPKTSSVSILTAPGGDGSRLALLGSIYEGKPLDIMNQVGDTHPSATAIVRRGYDEVLYVTKSNSDALGMVLLNNNRSLPDFDLSPIQVSPLVRPAVHGAYPNALAVSPDGSRLYVAEAGINSVAVLDTTNPLSPKLLGRIPTGWYPTAVAVSADGATLYIANAKGIGEDINPKGDPTQNPPASGLASFTSSAGNVDSNYIFGSVQKVDVSSWKPENTTVLANNFTINAPADTSVVPAGGTPSPKIKRVFFILHENKTFDSMLGNQSVRFGPYASTTFTQQDGASRPDRQYTGVSLNTQLLAGKFATAVNYYSDSEESDAGHQFAASGTSSDYTQKTLLVKSGRGILVNKNFEPEDYPEAGYLFNNAARHGVSFKDYGALVRIAGTDTGTSVPTVLNDPTSGNLGYPVIQADNLTLVTPLKTAGDVVSETQGLGQSYSLALPILGVLGTSNDSGEPRLDRNYPGYNFNISDQRRAQEFIADFDAMATVGTLPQFIYIYQPNDHTGGVQAPNSKDVLATGAAGSAVGSPTAVQQVADGDVGLGMVVRHIMESPVYYNPATGEGSAIFITYDDAQSTLDHIHPHRTPLVVVSPYAKPGYASTKHYSTASIVKTEELLMGLPPANLGDLFATDLRDMFQPTFNGIQATDIKVTKAVYNVSPEGRRIWKLVTKLDTSAPDRDSYRLGELGRLSMRADDLHLAAEKSRKLKTRRYRKEQQQVLQAALRVVTTGGPRKDDDDR